MSDTRCTRRRFLEVSLAGGAGLAAASLLSACGGGGGGAAPTSAPAKEAPKEVAKPAEPAKAAEPAKPAAQAGPGGFTGGGSLKILLSSHFVPAYDAWFDKWAADWGARNRVEVTVDHILGAQLGEKIASEVSANGGHDILRLTRAGEANLFNRSLVDVSDLAKQVGDKYGWVQPIAENVGMFEGVWKSVPEYFVEFSTLYRKDLFDANGLKVPETWDDLLKAGTVLKEKGNPIGIAVNQKSNDANVSWTALLWCYGASYVGKDGKTVTINSPETKEALRFGIELYKKAMTDDVLSWDDSANNQFMASGRGSWIHNPISALRTIEKQNPELAKNIFIALPPGGPKARYTAVTLNQLGIATWSPNVPAAKAFIGDYFAIFPEAFKASEGYNQPLLKEFRKKPMPILAEDPKYALLQDFDQVIQVTGYPGPPTPAAGEVENNWIIPLMVGRAVQDGNVDEAVNWAEGKIQAIYAKYK